MKSEQISQNQALRIAYNVIYERLGSTLGTGTPELGESSVDNEVIPIWIVPINADFPRTIEDYNSKTIEQVILHLGKVGEIEIDARTGEPISIPNRHTINSLFSTKLDSIRRDVEKTLVKAASKNFARLINVKYMLSPVNSIVTNVLSKNKIGLDDLANVGYRKYIDLLTRAEFLQFEDNNIVQPAAKLSEVYARFYTIYNNKSDAMTHTLEAVLNDIMYHHYDYIYYELKLRQLAPYVHISTTYYDYALSINSLVSVSVDELREAYYDIYGTENPKRTFKFPEYLRELSSEGVGIMKQVNNNIWCGDQTIFRNMSDHNPLEAVV